MRVQKRLFLLAFFLIAGSALTACAGKTSKEEAEGGEVIKIVSVKEKSSESSTSSAQSAPKVVEAENKSKDSEGNNKQVKASEEPQITTEEAQNNARKTLSAFFAKLLQTASADADRVQVIKGLSVSDGVAEQAMSEQSNHQDFSMSLDGEIQVAISGTSRDENTGDVFIKAMIIQPMKGAGKEKQAVYDVKLTADGKKIAGLSYNNNFAK